MEKVAVKVLYNVRQFVVIVSTEMDVDFVHILIKLSLSQIASSKCLEFKLTF